MTFDAFGLRVASLETLGLLGLVVGYALAARRSFGAVFPQRVHRVELLIEEGDQRRTLRLVLPITLGRSDDAQVRLNDLHASRLHALIDVEEGTAFVEDLGSRNGTRVNARLISGRTTLAAGDDIRVGRARIVFSGEVPWT